jgi:hypothetical protein
VNTPTTPDDAAADHNGAGRDTVRSTLGPAARLGAVDGWADAVDRELTTLLSRYEALRLEAQELLDLAGPGGDGQPPGPDFADLDHHLTALAREARAARRIVRGMLAPPTHREKVPY